jgi:hypothetical protein
VDFVEINFIRTDLNVGLCVFLGWVCGDCEFGLRYYEWWRSDGRGYFPIYTDQYDH